MKYSAVLFDLDGTLLDTIEDLADSMNSVLGRFGFPSHGLESYKYFVGDGMENLVRRALPESERIGDKLPVYVKAMREEYGKRWMEKTRPYEGIPELLNELARRSLKMVILSNKAQDFTELTVNKFLPGWRFDLVLGARPSVPKKPDPAAALEMAERLRLPVSAFMYLGDTNTDMKTAVAAGMYPVGVLWGFREADELIASGAKVLLEKPSDALRLL